MKTTKTETRRLQEMADNKFGQGTITIEFERFVGFYALFDAGATFLGNSREAEQKMQQAPARTWDQVKVA